MAKITLLPIINDENSTLSPTLSRLQLRILSEEPFPPNTCFRHLIHSSFADPSILWGFWQFSHYKGHDWHAKGNYSFCR